MSNYNTICHSRGRKRESSDFIRRWTPAFAGVTVLILTWTCIAGAEVPTTQGPELPLWEAGIVGGGGYLPDYPAAGQNHLKGIGAPYLVYRGKIMRADREGARALLLRAREAEVDLGVAASFGSRSKDNRAREGMPDLDYLVELGPRLSLTLSTLGGKGKLRFFFPVRAVFSTDLGDFRHRGYTSTPALHIRRGLGPNPFVFAIAQLTANFGNRQICAYFYDVAPAFVRTDRSLFDARGGYIGSDLFAGVLLPAGKRLRIFTGAQTLVHSGAANEASPLFKNRLNYALATALVWTFYRSPRPAEFLE
ncbi:MAG: hypothetical protein A2992_08180 [Elusimicrobia bacterium RIFCSPLOWO2_01_FULL_59_12]|nr:MAG: hypothetical protein A2992_08180 [Elusimicrobia bacterium RIFCSPLOWO2_01_FULL_59_12]